MATSLRGVVGQVSNNTRAVASMNDSLQEAGGAMANEARRQDAAVEDTAKSSTGACRAAGDTDCAARSATRVEALAVR